MDVVDTSWLIALFNADESEHTRARQQAETPVPMLANPVILAEFLDVVRRKSDRKTALEASSALEQLPHLRMVPAPSNADVREVYGRHAGISWHDASAIATALDQGAGLRTFDQQQRKAFDALR